MIYKSLLPIIITLLITMAMLNYLISHVGNEEVKALEVENEYLLTINVFKQLNNTVPKIFQAKACLLISNPINYTCNVIASNITGIIMNALGIISNESSGVVRYEVVDYVIYGINNETIYYVTIKALTPMGDTTGIVGYTYPFNLCYYSQFIKELMNTLNANFTIDVENITVVQSSLGNEIINRVKSLIGTSSINITINIYYVGVFRMINRSINRTTYLGQVSYTARISPNNVHTCNEITTLAGAFYVTAVVNRYVNNTYYFSINGAININSMVINDKTR